MITSYRPAPVTSAPQLPWIAIGTCVVVAWGVSVCFPLLTYTTTLALFGLAHVTQELRYLRRRFGIWLAPALWPGVAALGCVVAIRLARWGDLIASGTARRLELGAAVLITLVLARWWWRAPRSASVGVAVCGGLLAGLWWAPIHTLLLVAVLHNWTPVPLIAEALPRSDRRRFWWGAAVVFVALPALIATGIPWAVLSGLGDPNLRILPSGSLAANYTAYLPRDWIGLGVAQQLFSAIVFAQCLHYLSVIVVLPRIVPSAGGRIPWRAGLVVASAVLFVAYAIDFREARIGYGVVAAVHAWVEVPILVLLLLPATPRG